MRKGRVIKRRFIKRLSVKGCCVTKFEHDAVCEDAFCIDYRKVAVSDGAGGGGMFANDWSDYLVKNLPNEPIGSLKQLNSWIDRIWEYFYAEKEKQAKVLGGLFEEKFYDEGSFATLAAGWLVGNKLKWATYGDSVVMHYYRRKDGSEVLEHSFNSIGDFSKPPYLLNWNDKAIEAGLKCGSYKRNMRSRFFIASDALAFYLLMLYALYREDVAEIEALEKTHSKGWNAFMVAQQQWSEAKPTNYYKAVLKPLIEAVQSEERFKDYLSDLNKAGLLLHDDYTLVVMDPVR